MVICHPTWWCFLWCWDLQFFCFAGCLDFYSNSVLTGQSQMLNQPLAAIGRTDPIMENVEEPNTVVNEKKIQPHPVPFLMMPRISSPLLSQQVQLTCQHQKGFFVG